MTESQVKEAMELYGEEEGTNNQEGERASSNPKSLDYVEPS